MKNGPSSLWERDRDPIVGRACQTTDDWRGHARGNTYVCVAVRKPKGTIKDPSITLASREIRFDLSRIEYMSYFRTLKKDISDFAIDCLDLDGIVKSIPKQAYLTGGLITKERERVIQETLKPEPVEGIAVTVKALPKKRLIEFDMASKEGRQRIKEYISSKQKG
jgi:hypothetical protein